MSCFVVFLLALKMINNKNSYQTDPSSDREEDSRGVGGEKVSKCALHYI